MRHSSRTLGQGIAGLGKKTSELRAERGMTERVSLRILEGKQRHLGSYSFARVGWSGEGSAVDYLSRIRGR